jgi:hypothetical protein
MDFQEKMVGFLNKNLGNQIKPQNPPVISWNELSGRVEGHTRPSPGSSENSRVW